MMGEVGELAELFQWNGDSMIQKLVKGEEEPQESSENDIEMYGLKLDGWDDDKIDKVQQEIADVAIYCLRLADVVGVENMRDANDE
jgi:NTP pyrophosphatase (non-canonical NTP hydrolase)